MLHDFIDAVSKNGQLLLNISPKADGTIPQDQRACLAELGAWLKVNGEAIYSTRPWLEYGEGPTRLEKGGSFSGTVAYTAKDLRYTQSKDGRTLYVIALGWPQGQLRPDILRMEEDTAGRVELLGRPGALTYRVDGQRLAVDLPVEPEGKHAYVFKLTGFETRLTPAAAHARDVALEPLHAGPIDPGKMKHKPSVEPPE